MTTAILNRFMPRIVRPVSGVSRDEQVPRAEQAWALVVLLTLLAVVFA